MMSSVVEVQWCDTKLRISLPIMKPRYWNLARMWHPKKYTRWYTFWCCYGNMFGSSPFLFKIKKITTICSCTEQNIQLKMLKGRPNEGGAGMRLRIGILPCWVANGNISFGRGKRHQNVYHLVYFIGCNIPAKFQ